MSCSQDAGKETGALGLNVITSRYIKDECSDMPVRDVMNTCNKPQNTPKPWAQTARACPIGSSSPPPPQHRTIQ